MTVERRRPPRVATEREMLAASLDYQRATLAFKCDGVPASRLPERTVPPSSLSLLGLVRHMAAVERSWFRVALAGENAEPLYYSDDDPMATSTTSKRLTSARRSPRGRRSATTPGRSWLPSTRLTSSGGTASVGSRCRRGGSCSI